jgi:hypothetical protein
MYNRGTAALTNCTVSGNSAGIVGGGMYNGTFGNTTQAATATLTDCTVSGNSAGILGGGVYNSFSSGTSTLGNTIVAGNTASNSGHDAYGTFTSLGHNLIGETDGSGGWVGSDLTGSIASPLNPLLGSLANNGGPTRTMALLPGSPAIDAGNNSLIPSGVTTDQRGFDRIVNGTVDIGAFEFGALPPESIYVLDATAGGALSLSGNATINVSGSVVVDSSSSSAIKASGNAQVTAAAVLVAGGVSRSGNASVTKTGPPGSTGDPLAGLIAPTYSGTPVSEVLSGNSSATISQGVYSQITVSGNAHLIMNPGVYVIEGGGFSVSGNASVSGSGVTIYNTKNSGGTYGSIVLTGNGTLTPATSGQYAGVVIFQDRSNPKAITLSGNVMQGMGGTIYAADAQLVASGNSQIGSASHPVSIVVDTMTLSGNAIANTIGLSAPTGSVAYTPAQIRAAYGINDLSLDGTGQTIAIVDAYDDPSIFLALDAFDTQFGLTSSGPTLYQQYGPASSFLTVLNQNGQATSLPATDPSGAGTDNWEVEEALDVEWVHAMAPGAQIVLVEANSQSLSDLMSGVATAAAQPGVSVVSMSWGFAEGQQVFAADEAMYDSDFQVPGVTFVASTGDYGAADPEYPAYSPNVVSVGGTSLTLNGDNSYNSETGWGYQSASVGAFIGSGGGISQYEPEPAFQQGVQSTGFRTTPDVSLVADPATGAWIADPYNLDPSNPFEVVGGTSLSAPAWAGLLALVNQGSAAAGGSALNSSSPTEAQQALYSLPQNDYNVVSSGTNGYTAGAGYNLVTGLGTPVANLVVSDLVAYQSGTFVASGPTVGALQSTNLVNTGVAGSGTTNVFAVFDSLLDMGNGLGLGQSTVANPATATTLASASAATASQVPSMGFLAQGGHGLGLWTVSVTVTNSGWLGLMPNSPNEVTVIPITAGLGSRQPAGPMARVGVTTASAGHLTPSRRTEPSSALGVIPTRHDAGQLADPMLDDLARDSVLLLSRGRTTGGGTGLPNSWFAGATDTQPGQVEGGPDVPGFAPVSTDDLPGPAPAEQPAGFTARLAAILLAVGYWGHGAMVGTSRKRGAGRPAAKRALRR